MEYLLCQQDNKGDFHNLCGLYADSAETDPGPVAGITGFAEDKQGGNKKHVKDKQPFPLVGDDINIDNRKYKKQNNTKNQRKRLDKNIAITQRDKSSISVFLIYSEKRDKNLFTANS